MRHYKLSGKIQLGMISVPSALRIVYGSEGHPSYTFVWRQVLVLCVKNKRYIELFELIRYGFLTLNLGL